MIIDRTAGVTPTRFVDRRLRQEIGQLIGKASRDDLLLAFLWVNECQVAQELCTAWKNHLDVLEREVRSADERRAATAASTWHADTRDEITKAAHQASSTLLTGLQRESAEARQAHGECSVVFRDLSLRFGRPLREQVPTADPSGAAAVLDTLAPLRDQLGPATHRLQTLLAHDRDALHDLAVQESYRRQSAGSKSSVPLADLDAMSSSEFTSLVEMMLQRDGFRTTRLVGAGDLISATCLRGHATLFSSHRVRGPRGWRPNPPEKISTPILHAARLASDGHSPEVVVVTTNGGFSGPARRYAVEHDMRLLDRNGLQRWAEWEEPMECVVGHELDVA
ncbi:restriction endonuclease [Streptomyces sp. NPDC088788]|uniref:restriction endonuclease n=1 Tax=Streptomyces sp. NPDC088788 TaxID=3365898 RepID=UPI0038000FF5